MIDTHCHLTFAKLYDQLDAVLANAARAGVDRMISIGTSPDDARLVVDLAQRFEHIFAAIGLHPHDAAMYRDRAAVVELIQSLATRPKVVAIGEMGMDRHYPDPPLDEQQRLLEWQLAAAADFDLPVVIHNRKATAQILPVLRDSGVAPQRFVFHCFTGSAQELDAILEFGATVGFTGITTFPNAAEIADAAAHVPLERMLIETDAPYLTPAPHRKVRPNQPCYLPAIASFIAQRRGLDEQQFIRSVDANAERIFALPPAPSDCA